MRFRSDLWMEQDYQLDGKKATVESRTIKSRFRKNGRKTK